MCDSWHSSNRIKKIICLSPLTTVSLSFTLLEHRAKRGETLFFLSGRGVFTNCGWKWQKKNPQQLTNTHYQTCINIVKHRKYLSGGQEVILCVPQPKSSQINACFEQHIISWCCGVSHDTTLKTWQPNETKFIRIPFIFVNAQLSFGTENTGCSKVEFTM